jgi:hypothetical protein
MFEIWPEVYTAAAFVPVMDAAAGIFGPRKKAFEFRRSVCKIARGARLCLASVNRAKFFEGRETDVSSA